WRNSWKFASRDHRITRMQHVESDAFAPDTAEEIIHAMSLLELWVGKAQLRAKSQPTESVPEQAIRSAGRSLLLAQENGLAGLTVLGENMEGSRRPVVIHRPHQA